METGSPVSSKYGEVGMARSDGSSRLPNNIRKALGRVNDQIDREKETISEKVEN